MPARASALLPQAIPGEIERARLANGLELCLLRNPQAPIVSTALLYRIGARDEPPGLGGVAHFLEHMMFKGSALYPPGEVDRRTQALGGSNNAFTSHDITAYWFSFAADRWGEALAIEADRMRALRLEPREVDAERDVILEEIAMYEDDPWDALEMAVQSALFAGHAYGRPILGRAAELERQGAVELEAFHRRHYRPDGAVLVVAGALEADARQRIEAAFGDLAPGNAPRPAISLPQAPTECVRIERRQGEMTRLMLALPAPPTDAAGHAELRLAATILAEGRASRLQRALVEEGQLCLGIAATVAESSIASSFVITAELIPGAVLAEIEARILDQLSSMRERPIGELELERARRIFLTDWVHGQERIHQQAITAGVALAQFDLEQPGRLLRAVSEASPEAVGAAARRWLDPAAGSVLGLCRPDSSGGGAA